MKVDGKKVKTKKLADTFLIFDVQEGDHEITFQYISPGFGMGMLIFVVAVLIAVIYFVPMQKLRRVFMFRNKKKPEQA